MKLPSQKLGKFKFPSDFDVIRTATLNKTDLGGGNNKFYSIEAHVSKDKTKYRLYSRYGRVGLTGIEEERIPPQDEGSLLAAFESLKAEKTGKSKGYVEVKLAQSKMGSSVANTMVLSDDVKKDKLTSSDKKDDKPPVTLAPQVVSLVERLYLEAGQAVRNQLSGALQTSAENPLGTLTLSQLEEGKKYLKEIQELLTKKPKLKDTAHVDLVALSNKFYSAIPQVIERRPKPSDGKVAMEEWLKKMALNNATILDEKENLIELLSDVQGMVKGFATDDVTKKHDEIGCQYEWLPCDNPAYKKVEDYMLSTRSDHHSWKCSVKNIWRVGIKGQKDKHLPTMKDIGNVKPLFHGSGPQNILGICKHGLLMRPPGVYITGSMFGNGLYFADQSSKSEQYAFGRFGGGSGRAETFFMFVTDVALGKVRQYEDAQSHLNKAPPGYHSVQGKKGRFLLHNEYIVYSVQQHILQYLIEFKTSGRY